MPRLLTSHQARFTQDGLFFYALLGLVAFGERVARFTGEPSAMSGAHFESAGDKPLDLESPIGRVNLCFLGMLKIRKQVVELVSDFAAQGVLPPARRASRTTRADFLK